MTLPKVGKLNQKSVDALTNALRADPALKKEAIKLLRSNPFKFLNKCFVLDARQRTAIDAVVTRANADAMAGFYILALDNPGLDITFGRTVGVPRVRFTATATNLTPSARTLRAAKKKGGGTGKKKGGGTPPVVVEGEGKFVTRC